MTNQVPVQNSAPAPQPRATRMKLKDVVSGKIEVPVRALVYGTQGVGKSTFAAAAPKPIFIGAESGTAQLDVARFPEAKTWDDVLDAIRELTVETHSYETAVVDTLDWAEPLCWAKVCERGIDGKRQSSIANFKWGAGFTAALDEWRVFLHTLEKLMAVKKMNVILLAHAQIKLFVNPEGEDYNRFQLKLHEKSGSLIQEWVDDSLFCCYETFSAGKDTKKAVSDGARIIHTTRMPAWDAKNRNSLPEPLPLDWNEYHSAVRAHSAATPAKIEADIRALLPRLNGNAEKVEAGLVKAGGDAHKLSLLLNWARGKVGIEKTETIAAQENAA